MIKKEKQVEGLILEWLKSENENATYIAQQICTLFDNNYSDVMDNHLEENASSKESKHKKITCQTSNLSVWQSMTEQQLIERIEEMQGEQTYLQDSIGRAETELFYRINPDCKRL